ncbi:hypothetical protein [Nodosilinea sp. E11]|uniref:hypothetical protein n=1 Tax=Nodosilinea sp. E11 TaxID=3037479 RepID=UPI0029348AE8|nr:hypothetical protein [Nodosilinea sp. E11]WOD37382.1 hypothetical protein RRF56_02570 [Nodosilinea sp. E11]WOD37944.1 hypothetical protein RRF56_17160 [Nodosilinea sp. E11]
MTNQFCEGAQTSISGDNQGRSWEHFWLDQTYKFSNQIPNQQSWTRTDPGWVLADNGYCRWQNTPPERMRDFSPNGQALAVVENAPAPTQANAIHGGMSDGGFGVLVLLATAAAAGLWWVNRGKKTDPTYHPHADLDLSLPPMRYSPVAIDYIEIEDGEEVPEGYELVTEEEGDNHPKHLMPQGNRTHGIPSVEPLEFEWNSREFEGNSHGADANSQNSQDANSLGIPGLPADSQDWPPKTMGAPCDPLQPEQAGEFDLYRKYVDTDGLNPKGNDIIKRLWGCTPGRSAAYEAARNRRDAFAKRLDYYRFEEA